MIDKSTFAGSAVCCFCWKKKSFYWLQSSFVFRDISLWRKASCISAGPTRRWSKVYPALSCSSVYVRARARARALGHKYSFHQLKLNLVWIWWKIRTHSVLVTQNYNLLIHTESPLVAWLVCTRKVPGVTILIPLPVQGRWQALLTLALPSFTVTGAPGGSTLMETSTSFISRWGNTVVDRK